MNIQTEPCQNCEQPVQFSNFGNLIYYSCSFTSYTFEIKRSNKHHETNKPNYFDRPTIFNRMYNHDT